MNSYATHVGFIPLFPNKNIVYNIVNSIAKYESNYNKLVFLYTEDNINSLEDVVSFCSELSIKYELVKVDNLSPLERVRSGLVHSKENNFDYCSFFQEGSEDCLNEFNQYLCKNEYEKHVLILGSRSTKDLSLGNFIKLTINIIISFITFRKVPDCSGDSILMLKTDFYESASCLDLPQNQFFSLHFFLQAIYSKNSFHFLKSCKLTRKSFYKYNVMSFFKSLKYIYSFLLFGSFSFSREFKAINLSHQKNKSIVEFAINDSNQENEDNTSDHKLVHTESKHENSVMINWCLTNICNYSCSYCPTYLHDGSQKGIDLKKAKSFVNHISSHYKNKIVGFELTGGEVTYFKGFLELISEMKLLNQNVAIFSNGNRKLSFWIDHVDYLDRVLLSFHSEQGDPKHFLSVVQFLCEKTSVHVNIMMNPKKFDLCYSLAQEIALSTDVSLAMQPLLQEMDGDIYDYSDSQADILKHQRITRSNSPAFSFKPLISNPQPRGSMKLFTNSKEYISTNSQELIINKQNKWSGWECYIGLETICIDYLGNLKRGWCSVGGIFGNIADEIISLPKKPIFCNKELCNCGNDIMTTKYKNPKILSKVSI